MLCSARPVKYSEILDLDRKVREFDLLPPLRKSTDLESAGPASFFQWHTTTMFREIGRLHLLLD